MAEIPLEDLKVGANVGIKVMDPAPAQIFGGIVVRKTKCVLGVMPHGAKLSNDFVLTEFSKKWTIVEDPLVREEKVTLLRRLLNKEIPEDIVFYEIAPAIGVVMDDALTKELQDSGRVAQEALKKRKEDALKDVPAGDQCATVGKGRRRKTRRARKTRRS
jgi:hypothetical protein